MRRSPRTVLSSSLVAFTLALTGCGAGAAATDPSGTATSAASAGSGAATESGTGSAGTGTTTAETALFADGASHEVSIEWDEAAYADMIAAYEADGSKEWIQADITIDGTLVSGIGVRLKGNSTLRSLSGDGNGNGNGPKGGGAAVSSGISSNVPKSLPLLIDFDKYVDGQTYQGLTELRATPRASCPERGPGTGPHRGERPGHSALRLHHVYSVNGSATQTRLLFENPDEAYADALFDTTGVLFKSDAESSFTYQGDDLATSREQFKQLDAKDAEDCRTIVDFLKWLSEASDEELDAGLADRVDVESFARYAATMNLLVNGDDIASPAETTTSGTTSTPRRSPSFPGT